MQEFLHVLKMLLVKPLSCCRVREQREDKIRRLVLEINHYNTTCIYIICKYICCISVGLLHLVRQAQFKGFLD